MKLFADLPLSSLASSKPPLWRVENDDNTCIKSLDPPKYFKYEATTNDSLDSLRQAALTSKNNFTFSLNDSPLLTSFIQGDLVIINGLETNPKFAASLETLLLPNPYLLIKGHKIDLPKAKLY